MERINTGNRCGLSWGPAVVAILYCLLASLPALAKEPLVELPASAKDRPNILLIVLDDLGFNDVGVYGNSEITTPNIDHFASQGVRFTRNYVNSTCTATRAGIMTGQEPPVNGFRVDALGISPEVTTLAESLQSAGYSTHHIGKWHLGYESRLSWPTQQGFDSFFGFLGQQLLRGMVHGKFETRMPTYRDPWLQHDMQEPSKHPGHLVEILGDYSKKFLAQKKGQKAPWFVTVWTSAPHAPVDPLESFSAKYPATPKGKYQALIEQMDASVGKILAGLDASGEADNTLVMLVSDNGGTAKEVSSNAPFFGAKGTPYEGGVRTPLIIRWPEKLQEGEVSDRLVSYLDYYPTLAAVARADVPSSVLGRNITNAVELEEPLPNNLYWEASNSQSHIWAVLSKDGRWRLGSYYYVPKFLNDLHSDPTGTKDVLAQHPEIAAKLSQDFLQWRKTARQVQFNYELLSDAGHAKLTGQSLQRPPGHRGHTFAVALKHKGSLAEARRLMRGDDKQMIVYQKNKWQIYQQGTRLHVKLNGLQLDVGLPKPRACTTILLTTNYTPGHLNPNHRAATVELYVNGLQLAQVKQKQYPLLTDDFLHPTYIGQDDQGESRYLGLLGKPVLLSERVVTEDLSDSNYGNGVEAVESALCSSTGQASS